MKKNYLHFLSLLGFMFVLALTNIPTVSAQFDMGGTNPESVVFTGDDSYTVTNVPIGGDLIIGLDYDNSDDDYGFEVYTDTFNTFCVDTDTSGLGFDEYCVVHGTEAEDYTIDLYENYSEAGDDLTLTVEFVADAEDAIWDLSVDNPSNVSFVGGVVYDESYFYKLTNVPAGADLQVSNYSSTAVTGDTSVYLFNDSGENCYADDYWDPFATESCSITTVAGGTYYFQFYVWDNVDDTLVAEAEYAGPYSADPVFNRAAYTYTLTGDVDETKMYVLTVPTDGHDLFIGTEVLTGTPDVELFVNYGSPVSFDSGDDCYTTVLDDPDECDFTGNTFDGNYFIGLRLNGSAGDEVLMSPLFYNGTLKNNVTATGLSTTSSPDEWLFYDFQVASGQHLLEIYTTGVCGASTHNDLYTINNDFPFTDNYYDFGGDEGRSETAASCNEQILINTPPADPFVIGLYAPDGDFSGVDLTALYARTMINGGAYTIPTIAAGDYQYFKIDATDATANLVANATHSTVDIGLYMSMSVYPTTSSYDNAHDLPGTPSNETVTVATPTADNYYYGVYVNGASPATNAYFTVNWTNDSFPGGGGTFNSIALQPDEWKHYKLTVPANSEDLVLSASGSSAFDLYTRINSYPTTSVYDNRDIAGNATKEITIPGSLTAGTYYVSIHSTSGSDLSGLSVSASYTDLSGAVPMYNGKTVTVPSTLSGEWRYYELAGVPASSTQMKVEMSGGDPDADLYYNIGGVPTLVSYERRDVLNDNDVSYYVYNLAAGDYYFGVYCKPAGGDCGPVDLLVRYVVDSVDLDGGTATNLAVSEDNAWTYYTTYVPFSNYDELIIETGGAGASGDVDLYVEFGNFPTLSSTVYSADDNDLTEAINIDPNGGRYYIGLYGSPTFSGVDLTVNRGEATWVADEITTSGSLDIDSTTSGDFILEDNLVYKRSGRSWTLDQTLTGSYGNVSEDVIYIQNGSNIDIYEYNGTSWANSGNSITGKTLAHAKGGIVLTGGVNSGDDIQVYDCTTLPCSTSVTISEPVVGVDTPVGHSDPDFNNWPEAIATDGTKIVVTDSYYESENNSSGNQGIAYVYDLTGAIDGYMFDAVNHWNQFGSSADIHNDQIIVGERYGFAPGWTGGTGGGTAHIYKYTVGSWAYQTEIYPTDACLSQSSGCNFAAYDVAIYDNYVMAGATDIYGENPVGTAIPPGSAIYLFEKTPGTPDTWTQISEYKIEPDTGFGAQVALTGNYYYGVGGPTPTGGSIILNNNPSGAGGGGGGGGAVPEFSDYVLMIAIGIALYFMYKKLPSIGGRPIGRA